MKSNDSNSGELNARQLKAIEALLMCPTTKAAAKSAGCAEVTIHRWLIEPAFAEAYRQARGRLVEGTLTALQGAGAEAVEVLRAVMTDESAGASVRVSAAKTVLEMGMKVRDAVEMEARLKALEERAKSAGLKGGR